ncbi:hypothetical protein DL769_002097 [Monosporascus sp. CRB-8-3]|nr:hypothetical protein DL769_002097 [Monosporascus sp. CRB-8-3]
MSQQTRPSRMFDIAFMAYAGFSVRYDRYHEINISTFGATAAFSILEPATKSGSTAANTLALRRHTVVVFDSKPYRNAGAAHMHMILTWDNKSPEEYRGAARKSVSDNYSTIQFADVAVTEVIKETDSYCKVCDASGKAWNVWKRPQLTDQVTIYTNGDEEVAAELKPLVSSLIASEFNVETRQIKRLIENGLPTQSRRRSSTGPSKEEKSLVHDPKTRPLADAPFWQTSVPAAFAFGDRSTPYKVVPSAITSGCNAAVAASAEIQAAEFSQALGTVR